MATAAIPQGGAAVFAYNATGDIFTVRADGTDMRQLTTGTAIESAPAWSPDGTRIAYRAWLSGTDSVVVMDGDGGKRHCPGDDEPTPVRLPRRPLRMGRQPGLVAGRSESHLSDQRGL